MHTYTVEHMQSIGRLADIANNYCPLMEKDMRYTIPWEVQRNNSAEYGGPLGTCVILLHFKHFL